MKITAKLARAIHRHTRSPIRRLGLLAAGIWLTGAALLLTTLGFGLVAAPQIRADTLQQWEGSVCQPGTLVARHAFDAPHATGAAWCWARTNGVSVFEARFPTLAAAEYDVDHLYSYYGGRGGSFINVEMSDHTVVVFYAPGDSGTALRPLRDYGFVVFLYGPGGIPVPGPSGVPAPLG